MTIALMSGNMDVKRKLQN